MKNPFIKASNKKKHLKIYLYGESGVGKTYFSLTFPNVAIIDLESGTDFFSNRFSFDVINPKNFTEMLDAVKFIESGSHKFETLTIDPVTLVWQMIQEGRLEYKTKNREKAISGEEKTFFTYRDWGQLKQFYSTFINKLINLPMHIIFTSRLKDEYEINGGGSEVTKIGVKPDGEKSTSYIADIRFRLEFPPGGKRIAIFEKDRTGQYDRGTIVENPSYEIFRTLVEENNNVDPKNNGPESYKLLINKIAALGLDDLLSEYKIYCCNKYGVDEISRLSEEQKKGQKCILESCVNSKDRLKTLRNLLNDIRINESEKSVSVKIIKSFRNNGILETEICSYFGVEDLIEMENEEGLSSLEKVISDIEGGKTKPQEFKEMAAERYKMRETNSSARKGQGHE